MSTAAGVLSERDRGLTRVVAVARSETTLARLGLGAIALHVLDDSFFQPQPGTSAGDHLVSGLVPFAVLLLVASVYPHLRLVCGPRWSQRSGSSASSPASRLAARVPARAGGHGRWDAPAR